MDRTLHTVPQDDQVQGREDQVYLLPAEEEGYALQIKVRAIIFNKEKLDHASTNGRRC